MGCGHSLIMGLIFANDSIAEMSPSSRPLSRAEAKLLTRHRLMRGALSLLVQDGLAGLSTARVAQAAGVAQPTFYVHFESMNALLRSLATETVLSVRADLHAARAPLRQSGDLMLASREAYRLSLRAVREHADLLTVFLSERYKPASELGRHARELLDTLQADLLSDAWFIPMAQSIPPARQRLIAAGLVMLTIEYGLSQASPSSASEDDMVDMLCLTTQSLLMAGMA